MSTLTQLDYRRILSAYMEMVVSVAGVDYLLAHDDPALQGLTLNEHRALHAVAAEVWEKARGRAG